MEYEREFVMIKPNSVRRGIIGEIITRLEKRELKITALKLKNITENEAEELYKEHEGKTFYEELIDFIKSGPVILMIVEGPRAIDMVRHIIGVADPLKSSPGSIRGEYGLTVGKNIVHASDSPVSAERELKIFFNEEEIIEYKLNTQKDL